MKKIFFYLFSATVLLQSCSTNEDFLNPETSNKINFPKHIEEFGKLMANEIGQTVKSLNERGVDYSNADNSSAFREQFYQDWNNASPTIMKTRATISQMQIDPITIAEGRRNLTEIQITFIDRIINECAQTVSYDNLCNRLININKDIYSQVPPIEQERLFYITSALYYGIGEILHLEKQGQMLVTPQTKLQMLRIKTRSEPGGDFGESCRKIYESVCSYVVGAVITTGEIVVSVSSTVIAGAVVFAIVLCSDTPQYKKECEEKYADCIAAGGRWTYPNSGGYGYTMCARCLEYCKLQHGDWDCPRPL